MLWFINISETKYRSTSAALVLGSRLWTDVLSGTIYWLLFQHGSSFRVNELIWICVTHVSWYLYDVVFAALLRRLTPSRATRSSPTCRPRHHPPRPLVVTTAATQWSARDHSVSNILLLRKNGVCICRSETCMSMIIYPELLVPNYSPLYLCQKDVYLESMVRVKICCFDSWLIDQIQMWM